MIAFMADLLGISLLLALTIAVWVGLFWIIK